MKNKEKIVLDKVLEALEELVICYSKVKNNNFVVVRYGEIAVYKLKELLGKEVTEK